jgi:hypothetical protein
MYQNAYRFFRKLSYPCIHILPIQVWRCLVGIHRFLRLCCICRNKPATSNNWSANVKLVNVRLVRIDPLRDWHKEIKVNFKASSVARFRLMYPFERKVNLSKTYKHFNTSGSFFIQLLCVIDSFFAFSTRAHTHYSDAWPLNNVHHSSGASPSSGDIPTT